MDALVVVANPAELLLVERVHGELGARVGVVTDLLELLLNGTDDFGVDAIDQCPAVRLRRARPERMHCPGAQRDCAEHEE